MLRRLFLLSLFVFLVGNVSFGNSIYTKEQIDRFSRVQYKIVKHGEHFTAVNNGLVPDYKVASTVSAQTDWWTGSVTEVSMSTLRNYYDLESNGSPVQIWQDPTNANNIHACYTFSAEESGWSDRTIQYFFSSDKGVTWSLIGNVPAAGRAGFGTITGLSSGVALIGTHTNAGASTNVRTQFYVDVFPGLGSFTNLDPGGDANAYIWPRVVATTNISQTNKFAFLASTSGADASFKNASTSITSSAFIGYTNLDASPAECYAIARGDNGNIGVAYVIDDARFAGQTGDVYFMESTDGGSTYNTPTKIFDANFTTDSLGCLRGISMVYKGNSPCVAFETVKQTESGSFFPGAPSKIRFWSPAINGGVSIVIADSNNVPFAPYLGTNDVLAPLCRPSIGKSADGNNLFVSMMVASTATGSTDTTSMGDIYLTASGNGGASWKRPKLVNSTSPRFDYRYANISITNDVSGGTGYVNMLVQKDIIPGSNVNLANPLTDAKPVYWRVAYTPSTIGVNNISNIADKYSLEQNYPNPFNPSTTIRFSLPQASNVMLKVYSLNGQEVATLINNQLVGTGVQEVSFNGVNLASGLYFYTLSAGNYKETKKMMLIK